MKKLIKRRIPIALVASIVIVAALFIAGSAYFLQRPAQKMSNTPIGNVHLTDYVDNDGAQSTVVISGAVGDFGHAVRSNANGELVMTLHLAHGTFQLDITDLSKRFTAVVGNASFNQETCSGNVSVNSPVPVIAGSGTEAYKGIQGSFSLTMHLDEVVPKQPNCSANSKMLGQVIVSSGSGNISFK